MLSVGSKGRGDPEQECFQRVAKRAESGGGRGGAVVGAGRGGVEKGVPAGSSYLVS